MEIKGYEEITYEEWRFADGETLHIIRQSFNKYGMLEKEVIYFKKLRDLK